MSYLTVLTAGHHAKDPGATSLIWGNENINTQLVRNTIAYYLKQHGLNVFYDQDDWALGQVISRAKKAAKGVKNVIAIDIHFNAFSNPSARGAEVIVDNNANKECYAFASELSSLTAESLEIPNRGVKTERQSHHSNLGYLDITDVSVVWEVGFLSNDEDMRAFFLKYWVLCRNVADLIKTYQT
jgi:N-acetylmuramoyl-L-alanine amidase